jgi:hypothetical protein
MPTYLMRKCFICTQQFFFATLTKKVAFTQKIHYKVFTANLNELCKFNF